MATNYTENYQLCLWEPEDNFVREEFNENTSKIDAALKAETDARTALAQTVAGKADTATVNTLIPVFGTYTGTGAIRDEPLAVSLGFRPRLLIIHEGSSFAIAMTVGGRSMSTTVYYSSGYTYYTPERLTLTDNGFTVWENFTSNNESNYGICHLDKTYFYFALR